MDNLAWTENVNIWPAIHPSSWNNRHEQASCKVYGKRYFSQGHDAAGKYHTTLSSSDYSLLTHWETFSPNITGIIIIVVGNYISKNETFCFASWISVTLMQWCDLHVQPGFRASDKGFLDTTFYIYLNFVVSKESAPSPRHGPDLTLTLFSQPCFALSLSNHCI